MFKSFDNNNSIPNNYVYSTHKGNEYTYIDGSWLNNKTMSTVDSTHNFKMNKSAIQQIAEHNSKNSLKIGKTYVINESNYTYVGRDNFTLNGSLLNESINSRVKVLVEADNASDFTNFKPGDKTKIDIPNKFLLNRDMYYIKEKNKWWQDGLINDDQYNLDLNKQAEEEIEKFNRTDDFPVNSTVDYRGKSYNWTGYNWVSYDGKLTGDKFSKSFYEWYKDHGQDSSSEGRSNDTEETPKPGQESNVLPKGSIITNNGKRYAFDGTNFVSFEGDVLPSEVTASYIEKYKRHIDAKNNGESEIRSDNHTDGNGRPINSDDSTSEPAPSPSSTGNIPNGFIYTSNKGKKFLLKNGTWISMDTKKPVNSSNVAPLVRAAEAQIKQLNSNSKVKIGEEYTSKNGVVYKYVGNNRFISDSGKLLPPDIAQKVIQRLEAHPDEESTEELGSNDSSQDTTDRSDRPDRPEPSSNPNPGETPQGGSGSNDTSGLDGLAQQIKSNREARRIIVLLSRGDDLSLLAADILLSGKQHEVVQILNSLNTED